MGTVLVAVLAGWLALLTPDGADRQGAGKNSPPKDVPLSEDERIERGEDLGRQAGALWQQGKFKEAAKKFEQSAELDPDAANTWNGLGWARLNGGNAEKAVEAFEKCLALEPEHPAALNGLGQIYLMWADFQQAEKYLLKAAPKASAAWFGLSRLYLLTGKYDEAQTWIQKALGASPNDESLKQMLAAAQKGELPPDLRKQIEPAGKPSNLPADKLAAEGWRQFNQGNSRSAERNFRRALAKDPDNLAAINGLGFTSLNMGKTAEAKALFERYLNKEPDAAGPMNGLARCLKEEGKVEEAIALWEKMAKKYPGPSAATVGLATTYSERKEYAKAIPYFEELVQSDPNNAEFKQGLEAARSAAKAP